MSSKSELPLVSVIVPVQNGADSIVRNVEALLAQDYPREKYEVIIVDNGSLDSTKELTGKYPITLLEENGVKNSYVARNKGISFSKGQILAFTDSDCVPDPGWLSAGVKALLDENAYMAGGKIEFFFSEKRSAAELLDSLINLDNESYIKLRHSAQTANVFIRRDLFDKIGPFPTGQVSGGDAIWTNKSWKAGFKLVYAERAVVLHPTRNLSGLLQKHFRVGRGCIAVWRERGHGIAWIICRFFSLFLPVLALRLPHIIKRRGRKDIHYPLPKMMLLSFLCSMATACGIVKSLFSDPVQK
jgi:glycosyltransferase involved in cell wall biosynthesis